MCLRLSRANIFSGTRLERDITFQSELAAHDSVDLAESAEQKQHFMEKT